MQNKENEFSRGTFLYRGLTLLSGAALGHVLMCGESPKVAQPTKLIGRADPDYEAMRGGFNRRINQYPHAIALCRNENDVRLAIQYANHKNLKLAVKSSGHSFEGFSTSGDALVIDLSAMKHQEYNKANRIYRAEPAVQLAPAYHYLFGQGRLVPMGSCATVAVGGLTLGGGYGLFSRKFGLTCDNLVRARMVNGSGRLIDTNDNPDLLWALRGGGNGNFGVVTSLSFKTVPMPRRLRAYRFKSVNLTGRTAAQVCEQWFELMRNLPTTAFSAFVLNGQRLLILVTDFSDASPPADLKKILTRLEKIADKTYKPTRRPLPRAVRSYYGVQKPIYFRNNSAGYYRDFSSIADKAEEVFSAVTAAKGVIFQINTLGGKIDVGTIRGKSAYPHGEFPFLGELQSYWNSGPQPEKQKRAFATIQKLIKDVGINRHYRNYPSLDFDNPLQEYYGESLSRLTELKRKHDPRDLFSHAQTLKG